MEFVEKNVGKDPAARAELMEIGILSLPVLIIGEQRLTGFNPKKIDGELGVLLDGDRFGPDTHGSILGGLLRRGLGRGFSAPVQQGVQQDGTKGRGADAAQGEAAKLEREVACA